VIEVQVKAHILFGGNNQQQNNQHHAPDIFAEKLGSLLLHNKLFFYGNIKQIVANCNTHYPIAKKIPPKQLLFRGYG
jgi:hypothetical protein